jgi:hypothetical protein
MEERRIKEKTPGGFWIEIIQEGAKTVGEHSRAIRVGLVWPTAIGRGFHCLVGLLSESLPIRTPFSDKELISMDEDGKTKIVITPFSPEEEYETLKQWYLAIKDRIVEAIRTGILIYERIDVPPKNTLHLN